MGCALGRARFVVVPVRPACLRLRFCCGLVAVAVALAVAARSCGHLLDDALQTDESDGRRHRHQDPGRTKDAAPPRGLVAQHVGDEGECEAEGDEHRRAFGEVLEVLQAAAEHADAERQCEGGRHHATDLRGAGAAAGEDEFVEDCGAEEDGGAYDGDEGVAGGIERVVHDGAADQPGSDEGRGTAQVVTEQRGALGGPATPASTAGPVRGLASRAARRGRGAVSVG